jgi:nicotinate-nucleotide adenylyltransferase
MAPAEAPELSAPAVARARIALLGGTFDPLHNAHLALGRHLARLLRLDELVLMPAGQPWQKPHVSAAEHRLAMVRLGARQLAGTLAGTRISVSTDEIGHDGPTYTVDTLRAWRARLGPDPSLTLLIGADQLARLDTWHAWRELFDYAHVCASSRAGFGLVDVSPALSLEIAQRRAAPDALGMRRAGLILLDDTLQLDTSATGIREAIRQGADAANAARANMPPDVWDYIQEHHLYQ